MECNETALHILLKRLAERRNVLDIAIRCMSVVCNVGVLRQNVGKCLIFLRGRFIAEIRTEFL